MIHALWVHVPLLERFASIEIILGGKVWDAMKHVSEVLVLNLWRGRPGALEGSEGLAESLG